MFLYLEINFYFKQRTSTCTPKWIFTGICAFINIIYTSNWTAKHLENPVKNTTLLGTICILKKRLNLPQRDVKLTYDKG